MTISTYQSFKDSYLINIHANGTDYKFHRKGCRMAQILLCACKVLVNELKFKLRGVK